MYDERLQVYVVVISRLYFRHSLSTLQFRLKWITNLYETTWSFVTGSRDTGRTCIIIFRWVKLCFIAQLGNYTSFFFPRLQILHIIHLFLDFFTVHPHPVIHLIRPLCFFELMEVCGLRKTKRNESVTKYFYFLFDSRRCCHLEVPAVCVRESTSCRLWRPR